MGIRVQLAEIEPIVIDTKKVHGLFVVDCSANKKICSFRLL